MARRVIDFSDGFESASAPTAGTVNASQLLSFVDDAAYVTNKGAAAAAGDFYFNTTSNLMRIHDGTQFNDYVDSDKSQTVSGDKTFDGTTMFIQTTNLEVSDKNININDGGNDASSEGAGLNVERTGTDGSLVYEDALSSKWKCGAAGSEVEIATVSGTQTLTNKSIAASQLTGQVAIANGGTGQATQTDAFDALSPVTTKGDLIARDASNNVRVAVGADGTVLTADSAAAAGVSWQTPTGSGEGGINYITNSDFEVDATGYSAYADAAAVDPVDGTGGSPTVTIARNTTTPLRGTGDGVITKDAANRQGEGVSFDFTIDSADQSRVMTIDFDYSASANFLFNGGVAGDESDIMLWIYDVTNASLIQPGPYGLDGSGRFIGEFQSAPDSTSYRLIFHVATTNATAWTFNIDRVNVGPSDQSLAPRVVAARALGSTTVNSATVTILEADTTEYYDTTSSLASTGVFTAPVSGIYHIGGTVITGNVSWTAGQIYAVALYKNAVLDRTLNQTEVQANFTGNAYLNPNLDIQLQAGDTIDLRGNHNQGTSQTWTSDIAIHLVAGSEEQASGRVVSLRVTGDPASAAVNTPVIFPTVDEDTHAAYNNTTGIYTAPVSGHYIVAGFINSNDTVTLNLYVDGSLDISIGRTETGVGTGTFYGCVKLNAGQTVSLRPGATLNAATGSIMCIHRMSGPSHVAASEKIVAIYEEQAGQSIPNNTNTTLTLDTLIKDTHNAVSSGVFTAPSAGFYSIHFSMRWTSSAGWAAGEFNIASILVNSTRIAQEVREREGTGTFVVSNSVSTMEYLEAGDTVEIDVFQDSGAALSTETGAGFTRFSVMKI